MLSVKYKPIAEEKAKLRLYLNDPEIVRAVSGFKKDKIPIPIVLEGKMVVAQTEDGKFHWFFMHDNPDFIPVFVDLETSKLNILKL